MRFEVYFDKFFAYSVMAWRTKELAKLMTKLNKQTAEQPEAYNVN